MMFEKLPPKPSLKGNDWAIDASNCQACNSVFTFFHRKHHCRRCGGIFCANCTQQRTNLRGQGEGPVRVCDVCKKLEDAARLELRSGYRHRGHKGASKPVLSSDPAPSSKENVGRDTTNEHITRTSSMDGVCDLAASNRSGSTSLDEAVNSGNYELLSSQVTPEELLLQSQEEKKQWLVLKREGKADEALLAFKRSKELERQAESLKLFIRRSQRNAMMSGTRKDKQRTGVLGSEHTEVGQEKAAGLTKAKTKAPEGKEKTDSMMSDLKELGWNDADLLEAEGRQNKAKSIENELAELAAAVHPRKEDNQQKNISSMEILAHKRKALALKKEGLLTEAKEELKKAKLLERQLEEQQLIGDEEEESDDDLRALMGEINKSGADHSTDMDFWSFNNIHEDNDQVIDVTAADMDDPEMLAVLQSMGWEEEAAQTERPSARAHVKPRITGHTLQPGQTAPGSHKFFEGFEGGLGQVEATDNDMNDPHFLSILKGMGFEEEEPAKLIQPVLSSAEDKKKLQEEVLFLKKEALALKRSGKLQEAKNVLRQAKHSEKQLHEIKPPHYDEDVLNAFSVRPYTSADKQTISSQQASDEDTAEDVNVTEEDMADPELANTLKSLGWKDDHGDEEDLVTEIEPSEEQYRLYHEKKTKSELQKDLLGVKRAALKLRRDGKIEEAEEELKKADVIERLMKEMDRASALKEERPVDQQPADSILHIEKHVDGITEQPARSMAQRNSNINESATLLKTDIQQADTATSKQSALTEKVVEGTRKENGLTSSNKHFRQPEVPDARKKEITPSAEQSSLEQGSSSIPSLTSKAKTMEHSREQALSASNENSSTLVSAPEYAIQQQVLSLKREALALKRSGRQLEAKEKLKEAKLVEKMLASDSANLPAHEVQIPLKDHEQAVPSNTSEVEQTNIISPSKPLNTANMPAKKATGRDRIKLQQESLAHKRKALALRREGKTEEADTEFELAKSIENQMEELEGTTEQHSSIPQGGDMISIEGLLDPQLLSALKGLGWKDSEIHGPARSENPGKPQEVTHGKISRVPVSPTTSSVLESREKEQLEQKIKSEKHRALKLKRAGQQKEALEVLRGAKFLERKLQSMS